MYCVPLCVSLLKPLPAHYSWNPCQFPWSSGGSPTRIYEAASGIRRRCCHAVKNIKPGRSALSASSKTVHSSFTMQWLLVLSALTALWVVSNISTFTKNYLCGGYAGKHNRDFNQSYSLNHGLWLTSLFSDLLPLHPLCSSCWIAVNLYRVA